MYRRTRRSVLFPTRFKNRRSCSVHCRLSSVNVPGDETQITPHIEQRLTLETHQPSNIVQRQFVELPRESTRQSSPNNNGSLEDAHSISQDVPRLCPVNLPFIYKKPEITRSEGSSCTQAGKTQQRVEHRWKLKV